MANRKYRYADWLLKTGTTKTNPVTNTFAGFVNVDQNNKRVANSKITTNPYTGQMVYTSRPSYSDYEAQIEQNEKIANAPEVTPNYGMYAAPQPVQASPFNYGAPKLATAVNANTEAVKAETGSVPETDASGYAEYLAQHPEIGEAEKKAESEYARKLATYGVNAENLAQAGIHGGFGDYVDAAAYAQLQERKAEIEKEARTRYADYLQRVGAEEEEKASVKDQTVAQLYDYLVSDEQANLLAYPDEAYQMQRPSIRQDLLNRKIAESAVDEALKMVDDKRKQDADAHKASIRQYTDNLISGGDVEEYLQKLGVSTVPQRDQYDTDEAYNEAVEDYKNNPNKYLTKNYYDTLTALFKSGQIEQSQISKAIVNTLPINGEDFETSDWKGEGYDLFASIKKVNESKELGEITDDDYKSFVEEVKGILKKAGVTTVKYENVGVTDNLFIQLEVNGEKEDIHADQIGGKPSTSTLAKLKKYNDIPLAYIVDDDGNYTLYYQNRYGWRQLSTKKGSTSGSPDNGNYWFAAIALLMMNNGVDEEVKTNETNWFKSQKWSYNIK